jgi:putative transcriptional regulator
MAATTDRDIQRQILEDPDSAPDVTRLGRGRPGTLPPIEPARLAAIRRRTGLTQAAFAAALRIPVASYRNWEQGRTRPDPVARSLLHVVERDPERVLALLAAAE